MTKTLTYTSFVIASLLIGAIFITANTYPQLAVAIVLYPILIFLAFNVFPRKSWKIPKVLANAQSKSHQSTAETPKLKAEAMYVSDIERRAFIKLIGATGVTFFLFSLLGRRAESMIFGRNAQPGFDSTGNNTQNNLQGSPTDGYKIAEIDESEISYFGFTNKDGGWLIMREEVDGSSFRYVKGNTDFSGNWTNRANLTYDYFHNIS